MKNSWCLVFFYQRWWSVSWDHVKLIVHKTPYLENQMSFTENTSLLLWLIKLDQGWSILVNSESYLLKQLVVTNHEEKKWSVMKGHDQSWNVMINHYLREVFSVYTDISLHCLRTARFNLRTLHSSGKELFLCYLSLEKSLGESSGVIGPKENKLDPSGGLSVFAKCQAKLHFAIWKTNFPSLSIQ